MRIIFRVISMNSRQFFPRITDTSIYKRNPQFLFTAFRRVAALLETPVTNNLVDDGCSKQERMMDVARLGVRIR